MNKRQYGLIGYKLGHSFSRAYFTQKFEKEKIPATYENYELEQIDDVRDLLETDIKGFNVTIPYKKQILPFLDRVDGVAAEIGAVNTIKRQDDNWIGYNTDVYGFRQMIKPFSKSHHERAMILGTGGAAEAVNYVLGHLGVNVISISRSPKGSNQFHYNEVNKNMIRFNGIIVNTTPVGTFPNVDECPDIPYHFINDQHLVIDLIYNPEETLFLKKSKDAGAVTLNGKTMLQQQAEEAWRIWND
ncbi:MAG: shikimate dehydrogenase family protein [Crocinitomicaceae bacterium]